MAAASSTAGLVFPVRRKTPELVAPAKPTPHEYKLLSDIDDQDGLRFQIPVIQFYRNKVNESMEAGRDPVKVIRQAIAKTLVWYYPFAGRLRELAGAGRKLMVDCTGEGVLFIEADADVTLDDFGDALQPPFPCLDQLLFDVPGSGGVLDCPLLLIQYITSKALQYTSSSFSPESGAQGEKLGDQYLSGLAGANQAHSGDFFSLRTTMDNNKNSQMDLIHAFVALQQLMSAINYACALYVVVMHAALQRSVERLPVERSPHPFQTQLVHLNRLFRNNDTNCHEQLRVDIRTFNILCTLVRGVGLTDSKYVVLEEKVGMFLKTIAHHKKNRVIKFDFFRSGQTVSKYFNQVLKAILKLQDVLLKHPEPVPANCDDERWKWFQNCLGALDGTYVDVRVAAIDKPRYRTRKGQVATNVLGVCAPDTQFIYVLSGWEGSASDSRVLRDAVSRQNGLKVPTGQYYLVDAGYTNGEGFLAPYRGQRYHLSTFRDGPNPTTPEELFNVKHASARNVVERTFGILKARWAILRSHSFFPIRTQCRIITACCLLHNLITREMPDDPFAAEFDEPPPPTQPIDEEEDYIDVVEASDQWSEWRTALANQMFTEWQANRGQGGGGNAA